MYFSTKTTTKLVRNLALGDLGVALLSALVALARALLPAPCVFFVLFAVPNRKRECSDAQWPWGKKGHPVFVGRVLRGTLPKERGKRAPLGNRQSNQKETSTFFWRLGNMTKHIPTPNQTRKLHGCTLHTKTPSPHLLSAELGLLVPLSSIW